MVVIFVLNFHLSLLVGISACGALPGCLDSLRFIKEGKVIELALPAIVTTQGCRIEYSTVNIRLLIAFDDETDSNQLFRLVNPVSRRYQLLTSLLLVLIVGLIREHSALILGQKLATIIFALLRGIYRIEPLIVVRLSHHAVVDLGRLLALQVA